MKTNYLFKKLSLVLSFVLLSSLVFGQSVTATFSSGDISTEKISSITTSATSACADTLDVSVPSGAVITGVDVAYSMTALSTNYAYMSEQRSFIRCVSTGGTVEASVTSGVGSSSGTMTYARTGLSIANAVVSTGTVQFQMNAFRTYGGAAGSCGVDYSKVDNSTWIITVNYFVPVALDASIQEIIVPPTAVATPVKVVLKNFGSTTLTAATINWSVDGTAQTAYSWTGTLAQFASDTVTLPAYTFSAGSHTIVAASSAPNGGTDGNTANDTANFTATFFGVINTFPYSENFSSSNAYWPLSSGSLSNAIIDTAAGNPGAGIYMTGKTSASWINYSTVTGAFGNTSHVSTATANVDATSLTNVRFEFDMRQTYTYNVTYGWARVLINGTDYAKDLNGDSTWHATSASADPFQTLAFDLSAYAGTNFTISIQLASKYDKANYSNTYGDDMHIDNIKLYQPAANDLAMSALYKPNGGFEMTSTMDFAVVIYNNGTASQSGFDISYSIDNGSTFTSQTVTASIAAGDYDTLTFTTAADLSTLGVYNLVLAVVNTGDAYTSNDTISATLDNRSLPYNEDFESYPSLANPVDWSVINTTGVTKATASVYAYSGLTGHSYKMYNYNASTGDLIAVLPAIYSGVSNKAIKFWADGYSSGDLIVGVLTDPNDPSTFVGVDTIAVPDTYAQFAVDFGGYNGTGLYIGFKHGMTANYKYIYLDDIELYQPLPNEMLMMSWDYPLSSIENSSANIKISVYNNGIAAQTNIPVTFSTDGGTTIVYDTITSTVNPGDTFQFTFTTAATFATGLNNCGAVVNNGDAVPDNDSVFYDMTNFSMPYFNDFENSVNYEMPNGWSPINTTGSASAFVYAYSYAYYAHSGTYSLRMYNYNISTGFLGATLPEYGGTTLTDKRVRFWMAGSTGTDVIVGVMTDVNDTSTFIGVDTFAVTSTSTFHEVFFTSYTGSGKYVAFKHSMGGTYKSIYIDDVEFDMPVANDVKPTALYSPVTGICGDAADSVQVIVFNNGTSVQVSVPVTAVIGTTTLTGTSGSIAAGGADTVYMGSFNTSAMQTYNVTIYTTLANDGNTANDTMMTSFTIDTLEALPYLEAFETDNGIWEVNNFFRSAISGDYALRGYTSTGYMRDFSSKKKLGVISANDYLSFDYIVKYYATAKSMDSDTIFVLASSDCGVNVDTLFAIDSSMHQTPTIDYTHKMVSLASYAGQSLSLTFKVQRGATGGSKYYWFDNIAISTPPTVDLGIDTAICADANIDLDAGMGAGYAYLWTANGDTVANTTSILNTDSAGTYTVELTAPAGVAYDTIVISVNALPASSFTGLDTAYCTNDMAAVLVGTPSTGVFSGNGVTGTSFDPMAAGAGTHIVSYTVTDATSGCAGVAMDTTMVTAAPVAVMSPDVAICEGDSTTISAGAVAATPSLIFSTYIEGSAQNKALEVYNATADTLDLGDYSIAMNYNGNPWNGQFRFPAGYLLAPGDVYVIAHADADAAILAVADTAVVNPYSGGTSYVVSFNGDDVRGLFKHTATDSMMIDIIGRYDLVDPGSGWDVAGVTNGTKDHSLVRKPLIAGGNTDWDAIAGTDSMSSEYMVYPKNDFSSLGNHTATPVVNNDTYLWSTGATTAMITVMPTMTTTYTVVIDNGICQETDSVIVTVNAIPVVNLGNDTTIKASWSLTLDAGNPNASWMWSTGGTMQTETFDNTNLIVGANVVYVAVAENNCSSSDTINIEVMDDVSINESINNMNLDVYPNPSNGQFTMSIEGFEGSLEMNIVDLAGQVVYTESINVAGSYTNKFNVNSLASGVYYIKLISKDGVKVQKLVIQ